MKENGREQREIINGNKCKLIQIQFISDKKIEEQYQLMQKVKKANANLFISDNKLKIEIAII